MISRCAIHAHSYGETCEADRNKILNYTAPTSHSMYFSLRLPITCTHAHLPTYTCYRRSPSRSPPLTHPKHQYHITLTHYHPHTPPGLAPYTSTFCRCLRVNPRKTTLNHTTTQLGRRHTSIFNRK